MLNRLCRLFGLVSLRDAPENDAVIVLVHDQIGGLQQDWGPEIDELVTELAGIATQQGLGRHSGTEFVGMQYHLRFSSRDGRALAMSMRRMLRVSPMAGAVELFWRPSVERGGWKRVQL